MKGAAESRKLKIAVSLINIKENFCGSVGLEFAGRDGFAMEVQRMVKRAAECSKRYHQRQSTRSQSSCCRHREFKMTSGLGVGKNRFFQILIDYNRF